MSIPPAEEVMLTADAPVPCVLVIVMVSLVPTFVVSEIAEAALSFDTRATCPPAILISLAAAASMSIPPAMEVTCTEASAVPTLLTILISSLPTVALGETFKYKSPATFPIVKSLSSTTAIPEA